MENSAREEVSQKAHLIADRASLFGIAFSVVAGISGYVFNVEVAQLWSPIELGHVLGLVGAFSISFLPSSIIVLPIAKWASQTRHNRLRLLMVAGLFFAVGGAQASVMELLRPWLLVWLHVPPDLSLTPLLVWTVPTYVNAFFGGLMLGRRSYYAMVIFSAIPSVGKTILVYVMLHYFHRQAPGTALWAISVTAWIALIFGALIFLRLKLTEVTSQGSLWSSLWTAMTFQMWTQWDSVVANSVLSSRNLAVYAVIATVGRIPLHLSSVLVRIGISESVWSEVPSRRFFVRNLVLIALIGIVSILACSFGGHLIFLEFGLRQSHIGLLIIFCLTMTILSASFLLAGSAGQRGRHEWYSFVTALLVWTAGVYFWGGGSLVRFVMTLMAAALVALIWIVLVGNSVREAIS